MKYKGYEYTIKFCDPEEGWVEAAGKFSIDCDIVDHDYYETYKEADKKAKENIDSFINCIPQTNKERI